MPIGRGGGDRVTLPRGGEKKGGKNRGTYLQPSTRKNSRKKAGEEIRRVCGLGREKTGEKKCLAVAVVIPWKKIGGNAKNAKTNVGMEGYGLKGEKEKEKKREGGKPNTLPRAR